MQKNSERKPTAIALMLKSKCLSFSARGPCLAVLTVLLMLAVAVQGAEPGKEVTIVTSGGHAPDTVYLSRNAAALERVPFDGVCTWIATPTPIRRESGEMYVTRLPSGRLMRILTGEDTADVGQTIVHRKRIPEAHITPAIEDLKSAEFKRFKSNFIAVITGNAPGPMNWYDDEWWATICHNIGMIARVAKQGRCKGILIDPEVYSYSWWGYDRLTEAQGPTKPYRRGNKEFYAGKSVEDVMAKVRQRGREFAGAINREFPDPVLMFFHAAGYAALQINDPRWGLKAAGFGLIGPFIDGMLEGSSNKTVIVDCTSQAKWWTERRQLAAARKLVKQDALALSQVPELYRKKVKLGFTYRLGYTPNEEALGEQKGVPPPYESWMYDPASPEKNHFSPQKLEETLKLALEIGDGYILFWNYRANWWLDSPDARSADGAPFNKKSRYVSRVYWQALANARASVSSVSSVSAPTPLLEGYGDTKWRSSVEEVGAVVPELKLGRQAGVFTQYVTTHGKAERTMYQFFVDNLYRVAVAYRLPDAPTDRRDDVGTETIQAMINKKYMKNPEVADALAGARISIDVSPGSDGTVIVTYEMGGIMEEVQAKMQEALEDPVEGRVEAIESLDIEDEL